MLLRPGMLEAGNCTSLHVAAFDCHGCRGVGLMVGDGDQGHGYVFYALHKRICNYMMHACRRRGGGGRQLQ